MKEQYLVEAADWFERQDELTPKQRVDFENWLAESTAHREAYLAVTDAYCSDELTLALSNHNKAPPRVSQQLVYWAMAASVLLTVSLGWWLVAQMQIQPTAEPVLVKNTNFEHKQHVAKVATPSSVVLKDGSLLHLNAASALALVPDDSKRRVELQRGQVFFDVARDEKRPFIVDVDEVQVQVLGTSFDIERFVEKTIITVYEGAVRVSASQSINLVAGQQVSVISGELTKARDLAEKSSLPEWRTGWTKVKNQPITDVIAQLQRYTQKTIVIKRAVAEDVRLSGRFNLTEPETTLQLIAELNNLKLVEGEQLTLH